jgi:isopentenyl-diphosphate delta-isomerase
MTVDTRDRKAEHIQLALEGRMQVGGNHFESLAFEHNALPEIDLADVSIGTDFLGKSLAAPLLISCMTGGTGEAETINRNLAHAAERCQIALGLGSQRKALEDPRTVRSFAMREHARTVPLLANLGAVQLNYGYGIEECRKVVEMIDADALVFHLNPLQEAIQPEGDVNFRSLLPKIAEVTAALEVPVIAKEIGCGISADVARRLARVGVRIIDTAGVGGTSWARIEAARANDADLGELFADWGIPTPAAIRQLRDVPEVQIVASGGVRNGVDAAKALAMGADLVGMAYPFLEPATRSADAVQAKIERTVQELRICMFCLGCKTFEELRRVPLVERRLR